MHRDFKWLILIIKIRRKAATCCGILGRVPCEERVWKIRVKKYKGYEIHEICPKVWQIDDSKDVSMYLVEGEDKAVLIDTGIQEGTILPAVRQLTDKPVELALTHTHIDHLYHEEEFDTVYAHELDCKSSWWPMGFLLWAGKYMFHVRKKKYNFHRYHALRDGDILDLGGVTLRVVLTAGHTPGSIAFVDETHRLIFCGDAFGTGGSVWMWLPGSQSVSGYRKSLRTAAQKLSPYRDYTFYCGHQRKSRMKEEDKEKCLVNYDRITDMEELCGKVLDKSVQDQGFWRIGLWKVYRYYWKSAGMEVRRKQLK